MAYEGSWIKANDDGLPWSKEEVERLTQCAICLGHVTAKNNRRLNCGHIFCHECLVPLVELNCIICPMCRARTALGGLVGGVSGLKQSAGVKRVLEEFCSNCYTAREVFCEHCKQSFCFTCHEKCQGEVVAYADKTIAIALRHIEWLDEKEKQIDKQKEALNRMIEGVGESIVIKSDTLLKAMRKKKGDLEKWSKQMHEREMKYLDERAESIAKNTNKLNGYIEASAKLQLDWKDTNFVYGMLEKWREALEKRQKKLLVYEIQIDFYAEGNQNLGKLQSSHFKKSSPTPKLLNESRYDFEYSIRNQGHAIPSYKEARLMSSLGRRREEGDLLGKPTHIAFLPDRNTPGFLVVADVKNNKIQCLHKNHELNYAFGSKGRGPGQFDFGDCLGAGGVAVTFDCDIVVADTNNHRIQIFDRQGNFKRIIGRKGKRLGEFDQPCGIATDNVDGVADHPFRVIGHVWDDKKNYKTKPVNKHIFVCDFGNRRIQRMNEDGRLFQEFGTRFEMGDWFPVGISCFRYQDIAVADYKGKIEIFNLHGEHLDTLGHRDIPKAKEECVLTHPRDVFVDCTDIIYVADSGTNCVYALDRAGHLMQTHVTIFKWMGEMECPLGVVCTPHGQLCIVDQGHNRVLHFQFLDGWGW